MIARLVAEQLGKRLGTTVIVMNRPGAGATLAAAAVAQMPADGANLLLVSSGHAGAPALYPNLTFDNQTSFTPIVALAQSPVVILVRKQSPFRTIDELVTAAKERPGKLQFGNSGGATLPALTAALLAKQVGYDVLAVPYRGSGPANTDLLSGVIDANFDIVSGAMGLLISGDMRGLAVTSLQRSLAQPEIPTIAETLSSGFEVIGWFGVLAPAQMDATLASRFNVEFNRVLQDDDFKARLRPLGIEPIGGTPQAFGALIASETDRWGRLIRELGLTAQ
jgi:tripartite-type tricarboxylate transporter receptor subunit TctC